MGNVAFDWRVVAKRRGLESLRLVSLDDELALEAALGSDPPTASSRCNRMTASRRMLTVTRMLPTSFPLR